MNEGEMCDKLHQSCVGRGTCGVWKVRLTIKQGMKVKIREDTLEV